MSFCFRSRRNEHSIHSLALIMGEWERCIRTIGRVLAALLKEQRLDDAGLLTLTCEVEALVNGRPKMKISDDPKDVNHLHQTICSCSSQPLYYLPLPLRKKASMRNLVVSDIVLVVDEKPPRGFRPLGHTASSRENSAA